VPDGRRAVIAFVTPGDILGASFDDRFPVSAEAVTNVQIQRLSRDRFRALSNSVHGLQLQFYTLVSRDLSNAQGHILLLARMSAEERVANFLVDLYRRSGADGEIVLAMSRIDIADYLGLTVETISRAIASLTRKGLIDGRQRGHIVRLMDLAGLCRFAHTDARRLGPSASA
jgi:CRP/FNR family transcriptional regulator